MRKGVRQAVRNTGAESGQTLVLVIVFLAVLLGAASLTIDLGHAWWVRRQAQSSADSIALAAAGSLPNPANVNATAGQYLARNGLAGASNVNISITPRCRPSLPNCNPDNAVDVTVSATVPTSLGGVLGINNFNVSATATACAPCAWQNADIMMIQDRTGSMSPINQGGDGGLAASQAGILTLLRILNPTYDRVGMAVLPPVASLAQVCAADNNQNGYFYNYDNPAAPYIVSQMASNYQNVDGSLNMASQLITDVQCLQPGGPTGHATAIDQVVSYLNANARPHAQKVIIFLTDGAANLGPGFASRPYQTQPCHSAVASAAAAAAANITFYTIAYDSSAVGNCLNDTVTPRVPPGNPPNPYRHTGGGNFGTNESPPITPLQALQQMASNPAYFFNQPTPGSLNADFAQIAANISSVALIPAGS